MADDTESSEDEQREEELDALLDRYDTDLDRSPVEAPNQSGESPGETIRSRDYKTFLEEEESAAELHWYEKLVRYTSRIYNKGVEVGESTREELEEARKFMGFRIRVEDGVFAGFVVGAALFFVALIIYLLNAFVFVSCTTTPQGAQECTSVLPTFVTLLILAAPLGVGYYVSFYSKFAAKTKVIRSSEEIILSVLYMVVYMRSSPNLEGAVRFAAVNLEGPVAKDLKRLLWEVETGEFSTITDALSSYSRRWKEFNRDYVESLELLQAIQKESSEERRKKLYDEALDSVLAGSKEKMQEFSRELKLPVQIFEGMGILLPVLGMVLFPLVATFLGRQNVGITLFLIYDLLLPGGLYILMRRILVNRPPSITSKPVRESLLPRTDVYPFKIGEKTVNVPVWMIAVATTLLIGLWPIISYTNQFLSGQFLSTDAGLQELFRSVVLVTAAAAGMGVYLALSYKRRAAFQEKLRHMEEEFPEALFQLGVALKGGHPIEIGVSTAVEDMGDLDISEMFQTIAENIRQMGLTFEQAVFHGEYGTILSYPSQLIATVMRAVTQSVEKGPRVASVTITTIADYLKNVHEVQQRIKDLLEDTLSSVQFMGYMLAPVIAGVAVGMASVITQALTVIGAQLEEAEIGGPGGGSEIGGAPGGGAGDLMGFFQFEEMVAPELLQFVVGGYVIIISVLLGIFYVRLEQGENKTVEALQIGKFLIIGIVLYAITTLIIAAMFGGVISSMQTF